MADLNPVVGNEQKGMRPVVVISGNAMNDHLGICIVCPLTSTIKNYTGCLVLMPDETNGLTRNSEIITFQIRVISKDRLVKKLGEISMKQLEIIIMGLNDILKY
jgi:mRNA interferase MazF